MTAFGIFLLLYGVLALGVKAKVSYDTIGGSIGMTPVVDGVLFPPACLVAGLVSLNEGQDFEWSTWVYACTWLLSTILCGGALHYAAIRGRSAWAYSAWDKRTDDGEAHGQDGAL